MSNTQQNTQQAEELFEHLVESELTLKWIKNTIFGDDKPIQASQLKNAANAQLWIDNFIDKLTAHQKLLASEMAAQAAAAAAAEENNDGK